MSDVDQDVWIKHFVSYDKIMSLSVQMSRTCKINFACIFIFYSAFFPAELGKQNEEDGTIKQNGEC